MSNNVCRVLSTTLKLLQIRWSSSETVEIKVPTKRELLFRRILFLETVGRHVISGAMCRKAAKSTRFPSVATMNHHPLPPLSSNFSNTDEIPLGKRRRSQISQTFSRTFSRSDLSVSLSHCSATTTPELITS